MGGEGGGEEVSPLSHFCDIYLFIYLFVNISVARY